MKSYYEIILFHFVLLFLRRKIDFIYFMSQILGVFRRPHPGYANFKVYFKICTSIAVGVFLVLSILQPFNLGDRNILGNPFLTALLYAGGSYITMLIIFFWLRLFPRFFIDENWTLGREVLMIIYQMMSIASTIWLINYLRNTASPTIDGYFGMLRTVISVGLFPYLIVLLVRHMYLMKRRLQKAAKMNIGLMLNDKETLSGYPIQYVNLERLIKPIDIKTFLSAESKGDYLLVNISKNGKIEELTVNKTLDEFESDNSHFDQLFRCHKEFLINKNRIIWVEGNAAGYKLLLHPDLPAVNVSREKIEELTERMYITKFS